MSHRTVQRRTLTVLTASQVLGGVGVASGISVGGLLAADLQGSASTAGFAQTCSIMGAALLAVPMSRLMAKRGRRPGLASGYAVALAGAICAIVAAHGNALWLLFVGMSLFGAGTTSNMQARFAATDLAEPARRGQALAVAVWATTVGAAAGPNLAQPGADLAGVVGLPDLAGSFLFSVVAFCLAGLVLVVLLRPDPLLTARAAREAVSAQPDTPKLSLLAALRMVWTSGAGRLGLVAVVVSHTVMVAVMVMTPVHMGEHGASLRIVGLVISGHVLGMYAFSPVVGLAADRFGRRAVVIAGSVTLMVAVTVAGSAPDAGSGQLGVGLFLLGLGWSCGLVAGSTLVTEGVPAEARPGVQGATDMMMGVFAGLGGLVAGPVVAGPGFGVLTMAAGVVVAPLLALALLPTGPDRTPAPVEVADASPSGSSYG